MSVSFRPQTLLPQVGNVQRHDLQDTAKGVQENHHKQYTTSAEERLRGRSKIVKDGSNDKSLEEVDEYHHQRYTGVVLKPSNLSPHTERYLSPVRQCVRRLFALLTRFLLSSREREFLVVRTSQRIGLAVLLNIAQESLSLWALFPAASKVIRGAGRGSFKSCPDASFG